MLDVVVAVIINKENKIFIAQRNLKKSQGGLWKFPGGKIEKGETKEQAIIRELQEELNIDVSVDCEIGEHVFNYPDRPINLIAMKCKIVSGNVVLEEHENAKWVPLDELDSFEFAPADVFIVDMLKKINIGD